VEGGQDTGGDMQSRESTARRRAKSILILLLRLLPVK